MKKTQTIVDRERLGSDYIESKQDFSSVLSQVKQLSTTTWTNPWFYGPIGIAVFAVTISIVSLNPTNAKVASASPYEKDIVKKSAAVIEAKLATPIKEEAIEPEKEIKSKPQLQNVKTILIDNKVVVAENKSEIIEEVKSTPRSVVKIPVNNKYPHIEGVFTGEIELSDLFAKSGIQVNPIVKIVSFDFNYYDGKSNVVKQIDGNIIPNELHELIEKHNVGKMLFITNIKAVDDYNRIFTLPSINYKPILTE